MSVDRDSDGKKEYKERQRIAAEPIQQREKPDVVMKDSSPTDFFQAEVQAVPAKCKELSDFDKIDFDKIVIPKKNSPTPLTPTKKPEETKKRDRTSKSRESHRSIASHSERSYTMGQSRKRKRDSTSRHKSPYRTEYHHSSFKSNRDKRSLSPIGRSRDRSGSKRRREHSFKETKRTSKGNN